MAIPTELKGKIAILLDTKVTSSRWTRRDNESFVRLQQRPPIENLVDLLGPPRFAQALLDDAGIPKDVLPGLVVIERPLQNTHATQAALIQPRRSGRWMTLALLG